MPQVNRFVLVLVLDGLRPDAITREDTPTLFRLREEGVSFADSHAVFPTVTRVNATAITTGTQPGTNGIVGNAMYVPAVDDRRAFDTAAFQNLLRLDQLTGGRMVMAPTLGERLHAHGRRLAAVSSGSTGSALLLNPRAPGGVGVLVNGWFDPGMLVAWPQDVNRAILERFGPAPKKGGTTDRLDGCVDWTQDVLCEYVLPELKPDVVVNWVTEPDHIQHGLGSGAPAMRAALANDDRQVARLLERLESLGLIGRTNLFVVSDHGFGWNAGTVNLARELVTAGLKADPPSDDVVIASNGQSAALHVKHRDRRRIEAIVQFLFSRDWVGVVFTAGRGSGQPLGWVDGTFALELIHLANAERGPDVVVTFPWTSGQNPYGVSGTDVCLTDGASGGPPRLAADHGSMSPWNVRNTLLAWGVDVKSGVTVSTPAGNVDVVPTILALLGLPDGERMDGRVLTEALVGGPDHEQVAVSRQVHTTGVERLGYSAALQISEVAGQRYVDKSWRVR